MSFYVRGKVIHGSKIGRTLGFATANIVADELPLPDGVYAVRVNYGRHTYKGMANLGRRPSVAEGKERVLEVHMFDFEGDLYGAELDVELVEFVRDERRFESMDQLKAQIEKDREKIIKILK